MRAGDSTSATGGDVSIASGSNSIASSGQIRLVTPDGSVSGCSGAITLASGSSASNASGRIALWTGSSTEESSGDMLLSAGTSSDSAVGGNIILQGGESAGSTGGTVRVTSGPSSTESSGEVPINTGAGAASARQSRLFYSDRIFCEWCLWQRGCLFWSIPRVKLWANKCDCRNWRKRKHRRAEWKQWQRRLGGCSALLRRILEWQCRVCFDCHRAKWQCCWSPECRRKWRHLSEDWSK